MQLHLAGRLQDPSDMTFIRQWVLLFLPGAGCCVLGPTDIALQCPKSVYPRVAPRSRMVYRFTDVGTGVVDIDYTGNVKVIMMNRSEQDIEVSQGQRIA